ncbi:hypothetical protein EV646_10290 [Kribbella antiqua]|uniref:Uncharacterized protein n=1 Tax=Kribbella antiqua TaxID=2512217 RepID=A0A4R2J153_9ACTN|nr:hypothetical protein EV646_10290 [Kribbella antiqua]
MPRARSALALALGVLAPEAIALSDGGVRLRDSRDLVARESLQRVEERLARRAAAAQVADERLVAEAVALLGAELDLSRGGASPVDGATRALDDLLDLPDLSDSMRTEAQAMLRTVLEGNRLTTESAVERLVSERARERREARPPLVAETVGAAYSIARQAEATFRPQMAPATPRGRGRHRRTVGTRHRRVGMRDFTGSGLDRPGRSPRLGDLTPADAEVTALNALLQVQPPGVTEPTRLIGRPQLGVVTTVRGPQHFRVEIGEPRRGHAAQAGMRAGTLADPHVLRLSPNLSIDQLPRVWANQCSRVLQDVEAQATAPTSLLGRFRTALGSRQANRDRAAQAQYDEFRQLIREWRETRQGRGTREVGFVELDLANLAASIGRSGQPMPALPWVGEQVVAPEPTPPQPPTALAQLREQVLQQMAGLERAAADQTERAETRANSGEAATEAAEAAVEDAIKREGRNDDAASEQGRKIRDAAAKTAALAQRHKTIATECAAAAQRAVEARDAYQAVLTHLDALEANGQQPGPELAALVRTASDRVDFYESAVVATLPSEDIYPTATTSGRMPHLTKLCRDLNTALKAEQNPHRYTPELLHRELRAETRRLLSPDGVVLTVGNDPTADVSQLTQFELKLQPGELREVLDHPTAFDEGQLGTLVQGGYNVATTATDTINYSGGFNLKTAMWLVPGAVPLQAAAQVIAPGLEFAIGRSHNVTSGATEFGQAGAVEVLNGETLRFRSETPRWGWRMRTSAVGPWSRTHVVASGDPQDADILDLGIGHSYTVPPPTETVSLADLGLGHERLTQLPDHVASRVDGLTEMADEAVAKLRQRLGSLDRVGHDDLRSLLIEDGMARLEDTTRPGGVGRIITNGGRAVAYAQLESVPVFETFELLSDSSPEHKVERLRVGFSGASGGQTFAASGSFAAGLGTPNPLMPDLGTTSWDFGPSIKGGRTTGREDGISTADLAIHPSVQRMHPTVGVRVRIEHKLTVHRLDTEGSFTVDGAGDAVLRVPENDFFQYGGPVPRDALVLGEDNLPKRGLDGRILLRGDPQPTEENISPPVWWGNARGQLRGAGPALVENFVGADPALKKFAERLVAQGLIPPLDFDAEGRPVIREQALRDLAGQDDALVASQLENFQRVCQQISKHRLETGYDVAAQSGIVFELTKHRTGLPPEVHSYRVQLEQDYKKAKLLGLSTGKNVVNLDIGSNTSGRSGGRSKSLPWSAKFGFGNSPDQGQAGSTPSIGPSYGRASLGRLISWATGGTVNRVSLTESTAKVAVFEVPHTITISEITRDGDVELVRQSGQARIAWDSELCNRGRQPSLSVGGRVDPALLQSATFQHVDVGDPVSRLVAEVPELARGDSAALHHVSAFLGVRNLTARPELLTSEYRTSLIVTPAPSDPLQAIAQRGLTPRQATLSITSRVENLKYVGSGHPINGDINLTLGSTSSTVGVSTGNTAGIGGGSGSVAADGSGMTGSVGVNRSGARSSSSTRTNVNGVERLAIRDGQHYQFWGDLILEAEIRSAGVEPRKIPLENGAVMLTMPERDALQLYGQRKLDLPLEKVSDAVERVLDGNLSLPRRTTTALIRRYQGEKAGVTEGLAATHTNERLADKLRRLANLPEAPDQTFDELVADAEDVVRQRREVQLPEHYDVTMGAGLIDRDSLQDLDGNDTDLLREVCAAIEGHAPGALDDAVLATALRGDLAGDRWRGHIDDMLDPLGFEKEYPVGTSDSPRNLKVRIKVVFDGPVTVDEPLDDNENENAFNIVQDYDYYEESGSVTGTTSHGVEAGGTMTDGQVGSAGLNTDVSTSTTATTSKQNTRMSRGLWLKTKRVERGYRVVVEVEEAPSAGGATKGRLVQAADLHRTPAPPTRRESTGQMTLLVPASVINSTPPKIYPEVTDHRAFTLPSNYFVEGTLSYQRGDEPENKLFQAVYSRLSQRDMLNAAGVQLHETTLKNMLRPAVRKAAFEQIVSPAGYDLTPLPVPGHASRAVAVNVRAEVSGLELISDPDDDSTVQLGEIDREQRVTQLTAKSNKLLPTSQNLGGTDPVTGIKAGVATGEQVSEKDTSTAGNRNETSKMESGNVVTVKVTVDYHLDFERLKLDRRGRPKADQRDTIRKAATGEAYITMFRHEYDAMRARMEAGVAPMRGWDPSKGPKPPRLRTVRVAADEVVAGDNGQPEHHPYRPMVEALAQARREGVIVRLTLRAQDGSKQVYDASPDGTMTGRNRDDDGFAAAFATLHPRLSLLAEGRVDLRQLYLSGAHNGRLSGAVVEALQQQGIPAAVLAELDHTVKRKSPEEEEAEVDGAEQRRLARTAAGKSGSGFSIHG